MGVMHLLERRYKLKSTLISFSRHHIYGDLEDGSNVWRLVGIYEWLKEEEKYKTWNVIHHLYVESTIPILFGGDFNEILVYGEKKGC